MRREGAGPLPRPLPRLPAAARGPPGRLAAAPRRARLAVSFPASGARAGHELPFYPGYYPQEIRVETVAPSAAARAARQERAPRLRRHRSVRRPEGSRQHRHQPNRSRPTSSSRSTRRRRRSLTAVSAARPPRGSSRRSRPAPGAFVFHPYPVTPYRRRLPAARRPGPVRERRASGRPRREGARRPQDPRPRRGGGEARRPRRQGRRLGRSGRGGELDALLGGAAHHARRVARTALAQGAAGSTPTCSTRRRSPIASGPRSGRRTSYDRRLATGAAGDSGGGGGARAHAGRPRSIGGLRARGGRLHAAARALQRRVLRGRGERRVGLARAVSTPPSSCGPSSSRTSRGTAGSASASPASRPPRGTPSGACATPRDG